jgi:acyl-coenzyme A synthetase/AMP-(fatty) acid ligase
MQQFHETPLVAAPAHLDRPAMLHGRHVWTWRQVHAASLALVARLGGPATLCNLCSTRIGFLVAWLAALRCGCMQLLPASGGHADLVAMLKSSVDPVIVTDKAHSLQPRWAEHARCVVHVPEVRSDHLSDDDLALSLAWDVPLVRLYTSGSTGTPEPQVKTLGQLARGAQVLGVRLGQDIDGGLMALRSIVCSVPPQHMFGVETSVMLSLVHGIPVIDRCPLLPADVCSAFEGSEDGAAWVATPLHLRALVQSGNTMPHCRLIIASTMPLSPTLATQTESLVGAPVLEIYGSTETGAVATRRTAHTVRWHPLE